MSQKDWKTRLIHSDAHAPEGFRSLSTPVFRGSTVVFNSVNDATDAWDQFELGYTYGLYGTPTALELAARVCELEGGHRTILTPGGQGALSLINLALLKAGDHILIPESIYGPNRRLASVVLRRFGVDLTLYSSTVGSGISAIRGRALRDDQENHHGSSERRKNLFRGPPSSFPPVMVFS